MKGIEVYPVDANSLAVSVSTHSAMICPLSNYNKKVKIQNKQTYNKQAYGDSGIVFWRKSDFTFKLNVFQFSLSKYANVKITNVDMMLSIASLYLDYLNGSKWLQLNNMQTEMFGLKTISITAIING